MSGFRRGKAGQRDAGLAAPKKPWEKRYHKGLTPMRASGMSPKARPEPTTFEAKPGLGGRRHRLRRAALARAVKQ